MKAGSLYVRLGRGVNKMRIYLDCCSLQRPFDDRSQPRIAVEAEAILVILALCESERLNLISSDALLFEIGLIPEQDRKDSSLAMTTSIF
jgi:hypothetical protein